MMRKEETIRKRLNKIMNSKYAEFSIMEAGTLLWVLGDVQSPRSGRIKAYEASQKTKEKQ
jgi:hypothetical protein